MRVPLEAALERNCAAASLLSLAPFGERGGVRGHQRTLCDRTGSVGEGKVAGSPCDSLWRPAEKLPGGHILWIGATWRLPSVEVAVMWQISASFRA